MYKLNKTTAAGYVYSIKSRHSTGEKSTCFADMVLSIKQGQNQLFLKTKEIGSQAEFVSKYLKKGDAVLCTGHLRNDSYEDEDGSSKDNLVLFAEDVNSEQAGKLMFTRVEHIGRIAVAPKRANTAPGAQEIAYLRTAVTRQYSQIVGDNDSDYFPVKATGPLAKLLLKTKVGTKIYYQGVLKTDRYKDKQGNDVTTTYIEITSLSFADKKESDESQQNAQNNQPQSQQMQQGGYQPQPQQNAQQGGYQPQPQQNAQGGYQPQPQQNAQGGYQSQPQQTQQENNQFQDDFSKFFSGADLSSMTDLPFGD